MFYGTIRAQAQRIYGTCQERQEVGGKAFLTSCNKFVKKQAILKRVIGKVRKFTNTQLIFMHFWMVFSEKRR